MSLTSLNCYMYPKIFEEEKQVDNVKRSANIHLDLASAKFWLCPNLQIEFSDSIFRIVYQSSQQTNMSASEKDP